MIKTVILGFALTLTLSCGSTSVKKVDVKQDKLNEGEGYVLFAVEIDRNVNQIHLKGTENVHIPGDILNKGNNYILSKLPAGEYRIADIEVNDWIGYRLNKEKELWRFTISKGVVSYVGHFEAEVNYFGYSSFEIKNRSSEALEYLQKNYQNLIKEFALIYAGPGEDDFFKFVLGSEGDHKLESPE